MPRLLGEDLRERQLEPRQRSRWMSCVLLPILLGACTSRLPGTEGAGGAEAGRAGQARDATGGGDASGSAVVFRNATLIDVTASTMQAALVPHQDLVVQGARITHVGPAGTREPPPGAAVIDATRLFLVPGLWDMHVHTVDPGYLQLYVAHGVTGVRDMGGGAPSAGDGCESIAIDQLQAWRSRVRTGDWLGPELVLSGPAASGTGWPTSLPVTTPEGARAAVAQLAREQVDFVKVYEDIPAAAYFALAKEARAHALAFAGHLPADEVSLPEVSRAGQRSIEHVRDPLLMCFTDDRAELLDFFRRDAWSDADVQWGVKRFAQCPEAIREFRRQGTWLVPTLTVERAKVAVEEDAFRSDPRRERLPPSVRAGFRDYVAKERAHPAAERASRRLWWETQELLVRRMHGEGVGLLAGTDSACQGGLPGASLHEELRRLVAAGLTPLEALQAATWGPAQYFGRTDSQGALRAGHRADVVALAANPLADIANTTRIEAVVLRGRLLTRQTTLPHR